MGSDAQNIIVKKGGEFATGVVNSYSSVWIKVMKERLGKELSAGPLPYFNMSGGNDFLGFNEIGTSINLLDAYYDIRTKFEKGNEKRYQSIIEMYYSELRKVLKSYEKAINNIDKVETFTDLCNYKFKIMDVLKLLIRTCRSVMRTSGFDSFKIESVIESKRKELPGNKPEDPDIERLNAMIGPKDVKKQDARDARADLKALLEMKQNNYGTFADFVVYLERTAEYSFENLKKNVKGQCVIFISEVDGSFDINREKFDVKSSVITKGRDIYFDEDEMNTFRRDIENKSIKKSRVYIKEINKMYEPCVNVHDKVKELYWKVNNLSIELNLTCLKNVKEELKEYLDSIHFFVFGLKECVCSKDENFEDSGLTIDSEMVIFAKKIYELFNFKSENALINDKKVQNTIYVKKMCESLKNIYKRLKYLEKLSGELYKTALKIKKEYKNKMGKVKKLIARFSSSDIPFWFANRMMRVGESCGKSVKEAETLEKLTEALNEYIKYLERVNKFKKEILSKYMALEKRVNKLKLEGNIGEDKFKNFNKLKEELEKLNLREDINFSNFKKSLNEAEKEVKKLEQLCKKQAKQRKKVKQQIKKNNHSS